MVMPLGDEQPTQIVPVVNYAIIALNVLVFFLQQSRPESFTIAYAATPYEITRNRDIDRPVVLSQEVAEEDAFGQIRLRPEEQVIPQASITLHVWFTLLTSIFMHAGLAQPGREHALPLRPAHGELARSVVSPNAETAEHDRKVLSLGSRSAPSRPGVPMPHDRDRRSCRSPR